MNKPDCSNHRQDLFGEYDMKVIAEAVGNLHYKALAAFLSELMDKLRRDAYADGLGERYKLEKHLYDAAVYLGGAAFEIDLAWSTSKPHMKSKSVQLSFNFPDHLATETSM